MNAHPEKPLKPEQVEQYIQAVCWNKFQRKKLRQFYKWLLRKGAINEGVLHFPACRFDTSRQCLTPTTSCKETCQNKSEMPIQPEVQC